MLNLRRSSIAFPENSCGFLLPSFPAAAAAQHV